MNTEIKKQLSVLELSDLAAVIEAQEKEVSFVDLTYNESLEHLLSALITERQNRLIARLTKNADNPTIFVGQYEVGDWHERLGGGTQADSIMDRIIHNSYSIPTTDNNLRKLYDSQKARKLMESLNS